MAPALGLSAFPIRAHIASGHVGYLVRDRLEKVETETERERERGIDDISDLNNHLGTEDIDSVTYVQCVNSFGGQS